MTLAHLIIPLTTVILISTTIGAVVGLVLYSSFYRYFIQRNLQPIPSSIAILMDINSLLGSVGMILGICFRCSTLGSTIMKGLTIPPYFDIITSLFAIGAGMLITNLLAFLFIYPTK